MPTSKERWNKIGAVVRVASGNFLEMYDFIVYGYYAVYIGKAFFPSHSEFASLMLSLVTFGAGFLMRPLGAIVLGAYIDRKGRRQGLIVTLGLMAFGTLTIALTPNYSAIGIAVPLIVLIGRLLQGLSAGVELGGVSVYLAEIATEGNRGFYCSWQSASQQLAVVFTALLGVAYWGNHCARKPGGVGLANSPVDRLPDYSNYSLASPLSRRDGSLSQNAASPSKSRRCNPHARR